MKKVTPFSEFESAKENKLEESTSYYVSIQDEPTKIGDLLKELGAKVKKFFDFGVIEIDLGDAKVGDVKNVPGVEKVEKVK
jgi:hypothetical protein